MVLFKGNQRLEHMMQTLGLCQYHKLLIYSARYFPLLPPITYAVANLFLVLVDNPRSEKIKIGLQVLLTVCEKCCQRIRSRF